MLCDLDKRDTIVLKGLAISAIIFHNYFHLVTPVQPNEFRFDQTAFTSFLEVVKHPAFTIQALLSFFGQYGVQVFIFLTAFGLARSYWEIPSNWSTFMWSRVRKLYPMFALALLCWLVLAGTQVSLGNAIRQSGPAIVCTLAGISNLLPAHYRLPIGPWWFIPFILQFYAVWPLMRRLTARFGWQGLLALAIFSLVLTHFTSPIFARSGINLMETPIGHMRGLCLGIAAARYPIRIDIPLAVSALALLLLGNIYELFWPLTFLAALIVILFLYMRMRASLRNSAVLQVIGRYSMLLFLWNGIVRVPFVSLAKGPLSQLALGCISAAITFGIAFLIQGVVALVPDPQKKNCETGANPLVIGHPSLDSGSMPEASELSP